MTAQPVEIRVTRYQCPHCRRTHAKRAAAQAHMGRCWHNPEARGCKTCAYFEPAGNGAQCVPGDQCTCNVYLESCRAGAAPDDQIPLTGCPSWQPTTEA